VFDWFELTTVETGEATIRLRRGSAGCLAAGISAA
jgi:hypothetical protein